MATKSEQKWFALAAVAATPSENDRGKIDRKKRKSEPQKGHKAKSGFNTFVLYVPFVATPSENDRGKIDRKSGRVSHKKAHKTQIRI